VVVHRTDAAEPSGLSSFDWLHVPATAMPMTLADIQRVWHDVFDPPGGHGQPGTAWHIAADAWRVVATIRQVALDGCAGAGRTPLDDAAGGARQRSLQLEFTAQHGVTPTR